MANSKTNRYSGFIDIVNEFITIGRSKGIVHQFTEDEAFDGRHITLNGKNMINFGSCSYLGLETDGRIKEAAIDAIRRYGSQFSSSRTYTSFTLYKELEELLDQMFGAHVILSTSSTLGHRSVIPILIEDNDAVIFDHQAHISMQDAGKDLSLRGVPIHLLRHNRLDELETKLQSLIHKHEKVWYFLDGIYSMYGDLAPMQALEELMKKYKNLYLYVDDAHGMSWAGKNGTGYVLSQMELTKRMVLCSSLAKGFASAGGVFVFSDYDQYLRIKNWGGPLTYSGPQQPAVIGASIASAKIHLSEEIYQRQRALAENINYCNKVMSDLNLPVISESSSPIFFVGLGAPKVAYNMNARLMNEGLYVNLGIYPAVPETCAGLRFALTLHQTKEDIEKLAERISTYLPLVLKEEKRTMPDIYSAFRSMPGIKEQKAKYELLATATEPEAQGSAYSIHTFNSIQAIPQNEWDACFADRGAFDWNGLSLLENTFKNNENKENNWDFYYYIVRNKEQKIVLATFFTSMITKDDMLANSDVSKLIEQKRKEDTYYLTSKTLMMGTLLTDGEHLFLETRNEDWKEAFNLLLKEVWKEQDRSEAGTLILRDFPEANAEIKDFLIDQGFVKIAMEESHVLDLSGITSRSSFIESLPSKKRIHLNNDVLKYESLFSIEVAKNPTDDDIDRWYDLYNNVKQRNLTINDFRLPKKLFQKISVSGLWEVIEIKLKETGKTLAIGFAYKNRNYSPVILGLDYEYLAEYKIYKQLLFQAVVRAIELKSHKIYMGLTASLEKRKLGAKAISNVAYVQVKDNYNLSVIELLKSNTANPL
jgi:7-keto-8-aminopelargonate synthetase-like enzyme